MSREFSKIGIDSEVLTLDLGLTKDLLKSFKAVKVHSIPCALERIFLPTITPNTLREIKYSIKNVDLLHIMGHCSIINVLAYIYARYLNKPYVFCPAGTLVIHGRSMFLKRLYNLFP